MTAESMEKGIIEKNFFCYEILENISAKGVLLIFINLFVILPWIYGILFKKKYNLPPGPTGVPILGYIPFLTAEPYKELDRLKEIYGNVFSLYLGRTTVVILADFEAVKDAFSKSTTTDRPVRLFDLIPDGEGLSSLNGEEWYEQRKFCLKALKELGVGKEEWETVIQEEVDDFIELVTSFNGQPFDIGEMLTSSVSNNISYFIFGKRLPANDPVRHFLDKAMDDSVHACGQASITSFFPVLRDIGKFLGVGIVAKQYETLKAFNGFFRTEVAKIKQNYKSGELASFIVDYLNEMDKNKDKSDHYFNETNLIGNIQAIFQGGSDTTRCSIHWLLLIMAKLPDIQAKVQKELDSALGKDNWIRWSERSKVPYTIATIMEGQRWRTIAPLNTARIATEDIKVQNYDIPKGTTIIANNWGLHNDPKYWKNPETFDPERFLTADKQDVVKPDSYNAFSYGKRNCPFETVAMMELLVYFSAMMQNFTVAAPKGKELNMEGDLGLTYQVIPQDLQFIRRIDKK